MKQEPKKRRSHQHKYGEETQLSINRLKGWRYWVVRKRKWWHLKHRPNLWLNSPMSEERWMPNDTHIAYCYNYDVPQFSRHIAWRVIRLSFVGIGGMYIVIGILAFFRPQILTEEATLRLYQDPQSAITAFLFIVSSFCAFLITLMAIPMLWNLLRSTRNPDMRHRAPAANCLCGLYVANSVELLFAEFSELRAAKLGKLGRPIVVVGQAQSALMQDRALVGSIGQRLSSMEITKDPLYLLNGDETIRAELERMYGQRVIAGAPPMIEEK